MIWSLRKKKERTFSNVYFVRRKLFKHLYFISMYSILNKLSEYKYIYIYIYIPFQYQKKLLHALCLLVFKIVESPQCILRVLCLYIFDDFVERKYWILTFKVGYTFLQDTLYITTEKIICAWSINLISSPPYDQTHSRPHLWTTAFGNTWENWHKLGWK